MRTGYREFAVDGRPVSVWKPEGATAQSPLLVCHDGQNIFTPERSISGESWRLDEAIRALHEADGLPMPVVVAPWNAGEGRWTEYAPQEVFECAPHVPVPARLAGCALTGDAYARWCVDVLLPWARQSLGVLGAPARTAVMGSSMGGLASLYAVARHPGSYGAALCLSTHWSLAGEELVRAVMALLPPAGTVRLWFDHGTKGLDADYGPLQSLADELLAASGWVGGRDVESRSYPGADHDERSWALRVRDPLAFWLAGLDAASS